MGNDDCTFRHVGNEEVQRFINDGIRWMISVCVFVLLVFALAVFVRLCAWSRYIYYGPSLAGLVWLLVWRCFGNDDHHSLKRPIAVGFALPGLTMVIFGAGAAIMYWLGGEAKGSIVDAKEMMHHEPSPWSFYFSDGFVAHELAVSAESCALIHSHRKLVRDRCVNITMAPVFVSKFEADDPNSSVRAWAVPMRMGSLLFDGRKSDISSESCDKRRELISTFKAANPQKVITDDIPYICFEDPYSETWVLRNCWIAGVLFVLCALAVTCSEVMQHCEEIGDPRGQAGGWTLISHGTVSSLEDSSSDE